MRPASVRLDGLPPPDYYAPRCRIEVEGKELAPEIIADILSVGVTMQLDGLAQFNLTVNNWDSSRFAFKYSDAPTFDVGNRLHVELGYADRLTSMVRGVITTLTPRFPESGSPTIGISGLDGMVLLRDRKPGAKEQKKWVNKRDSEIAKDIARRAKLACHADESPDIHPQVIQQDQDDARFIIDRAKRIDFDCYVGFEGTGKDRRDTLFFVRRRDGRDASTLRMFDFEWGRNLVSFNPQLTIARQVSKVTVRGWNTSEMEPIVATATHRDLPGKRGRGKSGPQIAEERLGDKEDHVVDAYVADRAEAMALAKSLLTQRANEFISGSLSVMGNPEIRPGDNVMLSRLGTRFDGAYHITQVEHTFGAGGYMTQLQVNRLYDGGLA